MLASSHLVWRTQSRSHFALAGPAPTPEIEGERGVAWKRNMAKLGSPSWVAAAAACFPVGGGLAAAAAVERL